MLNDYLYTIIEAQRHAIEPYRHFAHAGKDFYNTLYSDSKLGRSIAASFDLFERLTREYPKPEFGITETSVNGTKVKIKETNVLSKSFCKLLHFKKESSISQPKMLVVAPVSGHYATLLRGTVEGLLPHYDVYITDWINAREVSVKEGEFHFEDFVSYVIEFIEKLGKGSNVMAVCQPAVPVSAAVAVMSADKNPYVPANMILIGGPIDARKSPTEVNDYAAEKTIRWFENNVITRVPINYAGAGREVYPGFTQLYGFMAMNLQDHVEAHNDLFNHLIQGDGDSVDKHKNFYNEYLAVMDMPAEFYLDTVDIVFINHLLPKGQLVCNGKKVDLGAIKDTALLCIEGERDDISGRGQTKAAIDLCKGISANRKKYHLQKDVGHYGIFNGRRYREYVVPVINEFIAKNSTAAPAKPAAAKPANNVNSLLAKVTGKPAAKAAPKKAAAKPTAKKKAVVKAKAKPAAKPLAKNPAAAKPIAKKPAIKAAAKAVAKKTIAAKPVAQSIVKQSIVADTSSAAKPAVKKVLAPKAMPAAKKVAAKPTAKAAPKKAVAKPATKKPAAKAKPAAKKAEAKKVAAKPAAPKAQPIAAEKKPEEKPAAKPAADSKIVSLADIKKKKSKTSAKKPQTAGGEK